MDNRSPYLLNRATATLAELALAHARANAQYDRTRAFPDWEIACEAQGRYLASKREANA